MSTKQGFFDPAALKQCAEKNRPVQFDANGNPTNMTREQMKEADRRGGFNGEGYANSQPKIRR